MRDQVTGMTYSDGTPAVTMSYDAAGRPLEIGNAVATDAYAYDDAGQLAVETQSVAGHPAAMRTLTHSHDADGLRTGLVYPGGKVLAAGYTARGQLATMTFHGQPVATSTFRPNGQPIGTVYGNGAQRTLSYDAAGRLTGTGTNVGAATITGRGYALDAVGRRTGYVDETAANAVFSYDPAGQVLGGTVPVPGQPASVNTYAYDPEGNRTQSSTGIQPAPADPVTITGSTTYTANPLNQYTAITGNPNPAYDADGNLLSGLRSPLSAFTCTWNGENRMLSSTSANVAITDRRVENAYDALGRRVRKTVKFASTGAVIEDRYFIYDGWNVIEETIAPATGPVETAEAVWGTDLSGTAQGAGGVGGLLLRESSATGASYYHYDGNGNVTALTSAAGVVQAAYTYGPFGETLRAVGPLAQANPWRFSTKYQDDETGLLYYGYRFYNPTDGRWPSRDPIDEEGGINLYAFCFNDGLDWSDYLGRDPQKIPPATYLDDWVKQFKDLSKTAKGEMFRRLKTGCVGVTCLNLGIRYPGSKPDLSRCFLASAPSTPQEAFELAKALQEKMIKDKTCCGVSSSGWPSNPPRSLRPRIFSVRFYSDKKSYTPKNHKGELDPSRLVDMSNWNSSKGKTKVLMPYDYGLWDGGDKWYHATNGVPTQQQDFGDMKIKVSTLAQFSEPLADFDAQVICVACEQWGFSK